MSLMIGAIADDFTGATDLANTLVKQGMRVTQVIGVPDEDMVTGDAEAIVVALKSRSQAADDAVASSLAAARWLQERNARQFLFKYCSTFDSTESGNIGPVADALLQLLDSDFAFICPAFPANHRSIYMGHLFVGDQLLSDSPMKNHPLTPMRNSNLVQLMNAQSKRQTALIPLQQVRAGAEAINQAVHSLKSQGYSYAVIDAIDNSDLETIGLAAAGHRLVTGGSGVALGLPANFDEHNRKTSETLVSPTASGRQLVLAGSCSEATRAQIQAVGDLWPQYKLDVGTIAEGEDVVTRVFEWALAQHSDTPVLIYASSDPEEVANMQKRYGVQEAGTMIEDCFAELARRLVAAGFDKLVVAGGETSGAVVSALGIRALRIGQEIDPGIPWTETLDEPRVSLALKSGNFGGNDFFSRAFAKLT